MLAIVDIVNTQCLIMHHDMSCDMRKLVFGSFISSPEPLGSQGELIGWP